MEGRSGRKGERTGGRQEGRKAGREENNSTRQLAQWACLGACLIAVDPANHQDVFHITMGFSSVWYGPHMPETRPNRQKIFHLALFKKNHFL